MSFGEIILTLLAGVVAGVMNTLAGGGALLILPLLIFLGLPGPLANGTYRVAVWIQCVVSVARFHQSGVRYHREALLLSIPAVIGAVIGAHYAVEISEEAFRRTLALIMVVVAVLIVWNPKPQNIPVVQLKGGRLVFALFIFFLIGMYGGFIQAGVGYFFIAALTLLCGFDLIATTFLKVYIIAVYMTFALVVFLLNDQVVWSYALVLSIGNGLGAWAGTHLALEKGEQWIRWAIVVSVAALALKLVGWLPF